MPDPATGGNEAGNLESRQDGSTSASFEVSASTVSFPYQVEVKKIVVSRVAIA